MVHNHLKEKDLNILKKSNQITSAASNKALLKSKGDDQPVS
jgi:hypothetical protein